MSLLLYLYISETPENYAVTPVHIVRMVAIYCLAADFLNLSGTTGVLQ